MKPYQYDKYVEGGEVHRSWQFGISKGRSFLWVNYENPGLVHNGFHVTLSFLTNSHLFGVGLNTNKQFLSFYSMAEHFSGWEND